MNEWWKRSTARRAPTRRRPDGRRIRREAREFRSRLVARETAPCSREMKRKRGSSCAIARRIFAPSRGTRSSRISRALRHPSRRVVDSITRPDKDEPLLFLLALDSLSSRHFSPSSSHAILSPRGRRSSLDPLSILSRSSSFSPFRRLAYQHSHRAPESRVPDGVKG